MKTIRLKPEDVSFRWECQECGSTLRRNYEDLAYAFEPYCPDEKCGAVMVLSDNTYHIIRIG